MMNSSIHDITKIEISELSADQLMKLEQKMKWSNKKLPTFILQNIITDCRHLPIIDTIEARYENRMKNTGAASCQKLMLDFIVAFYPGTKIKSLIDLCRAFLCHDIAAHLESLLISFNEEQNFPVETCVGTRFFSRFLSQPK